MWRLMRWFLILFCGVGRFGINIGPNDGMIEVPNTDDEGRTFQFRKFVYTSVGKVILSRGDYVCKFRGMKFVIDKQGYINKNVVKGDPS